MNVDRNLVDSITKKLADEGKLIESGWIGLKLLSIPPDAPQIQIEEMRNAFFAGAQHLFASIMSFLDEGEDITEADLQRMSLVSDELTAFYAEYQRKHNL